MMNSQASRNGMTDIRLKLQRWGLHLKDAKKKDRDFHG